MNAKNRTPGQPYFWGDDMPGASPGKKDSSARENDAIAG